MCEKFQIDPITMMLWKKCSKFGKTAFGENAQAALKISLDISGYASGIRLG